MKLRTTCVAETSLSARRFARARRGRIVFQGLCALLLGALACESQPGPNDPGVKALRRLTEAQYKQTMTDLFGAGLEITGRFEPEVRQGGLLAVGSSGLTISSAGFEQYYAIGAGVAHQVLDEKRRDAVMPCKPADAAHADDACAGAFLSKYGRLLFRRPLQEAERASAVKLAASVSERAGSFYGGLELALASLLASPQFLFRIEVAESDPQRPGQLRLDGYGKASRLSYLLWNSPPDEELLQAAESGQIHDPAALTAQVERLLASPRLEAGLRALFADFLQLELFGNITKDPMLYPKFSQTVANSAQEQMLRTAVDHLLTRDADYRDLFTTHNTFVDRSLAAVYQVPFGFQEEWAPYTFPDQSERAGLLTQIAFLSLFSHPGDSSPTKRGVAVNEIFKCAPTPEPPANVDFSIVNDVKNPKLPTRRARLLAHATDESCAGCHSKSDPVGLALEHFDSLGQDRHGSDLADVSLEIGGTRYDGALGLGRALHDDPAVSRCFVDQVYSYAVGRAPAAGDRPLLDDVGREFAAKGYRLRPLIANLLARPEFYRASPAAAPAKQQQASASPLTKGTNP